jgi:hypothetical protein
MISIYANLDKHICQFDSMSLYFEHSIYLIVLFGNFGLPKFVKQFFRNHQRTSRIMFSFIETTIAMLQLVAILAYPLLKKLEIVPHFQNSPFTYAFTKFPQSSSL